MSDRSLTLRDLRLLRDILDLTRPDHPELPQERTFQLLEHLEFLTGCDNVSQQEMDCVHRTRPYCQRFGDGVRSIETPAERAIERQDPGVRLFWECWWTSVCSLPERTGKVVVVSDRSVFSQREMRSNPLYVEYLTYVDEILVGYPIGAGSERTAHPAKGRRLGVRAARADDHADAPAASRRTRAKHRPTGLARDSAAHRSSAGDPRSGRTGTDQP